MRIDAHQHFWRLDRADYGWLTPALGAIHRDFGPPDLAPLLAAHDIAATILVQAAPTVAETRYLLDVAARTPFVAGVVGWVDFADADAPRTIAALAQDPLLVGLRPMVQDIADDDWLLRPELIPAFDAMTAHGLVFDALVLPRHLSRLRVVAARHADLRIVVDHGAKPRLADGHDARDAGWRTWASDIAALADQGARIACKLSGLATEAGPGWTVEQLAPSVTHLIGRFGADRLLWGSDWPVLNLVSDYGAWDRASDALLSGLAAAERAAVRGGTAKAVYLTGRGRGCR